MGSKPTSTALPVTSQLTFADILPTFDGMKRKQRSKPLVEKTGNCIVRIYKRTRKKANPELGKRFVFDVADYTSGKRVFRSFADEGPARKEAKRIADSLATGQATAAAVTNTQAASLGRALELIRPTGASLEYAASVFAKVWELIGDRAIEAAQFFDRHDAGKITAKLVPEVVTELLQVKTQRTKKGRAASPRYLKDLKNRLGRFATDNAVDIGSVTTADVQRWIDNLKIDGKSPAPQTARNYRTVLYTLFQFAEARGYIFKGGNPVQATEHIATNGGSNNEIFTPDEMTKLLKNASRDFLPVLAIGAFAGLRAAEIERLEWSDLSRVPGFIEISAEKAKNASRRLVPILPNLAKWLALPTYANEKGAIWKHHANDLRDTRAETVKAAGVPWRDNGLRHSFCSYRLAETQDAAKVSLEAGNSPKMVFKHYRELVTPEAAKAWFAIQPESEGAK